MTTFDLIGVQINITDDWPSDNVKRQKLKQASDYIEIINDLKECAGLAHCLTQDLSCMEMNMLGGNSKHFFKLGILSRSIESSLLSRYGRCFNRSEGRVILDKKSVKAALGTALWNHHEYMMNRRNRVIAHAIELDGRQPIRVLNSDSDPSDWMLDLSHSIDAIPNLTLDQFQSTEACCRILANSCLENAQKSFSNFTEALSESEVKEIKSGHYTKDETGSKYPIIPPASSRR